MQDTEKGKDTQGEFEIRNRKAEMERHSEIGNTKWVRKRWRDRKRDKEKEWQRAKKE